MGLGKERGMDSKQKMIFTLGKSQRQVARNENETRNQSQEARPFWRGQPKTIS